MAYQRINWKNEPIEETPLSAENLNHMEDGIVANEEAIEDVSEIVEGKQDTLTFDDVPTKNSNNPVKSNGIYDAILNVLLTDSASGNPCVITDAFNTDAKSVKLTLDPIQDLHGYSKPWVGGAGKNLYPIKTTEATYTWAGITFKRNTDGSIDMSGTAQFQCDINPIDFIQGQGTNIFSLKAGTYSVSVIGAFSGFVYVIGGGSGTSGLAYSEIGMQNPTMTFTINNDGTTGYNIVRILSGTEIPTGTKIKIQWEKGSSVTDYEPYTNICPISGRTQSVVTRTGKNLASVQSVNTAIGSVKGGTTYTVSWKGGMRANFKKNNGQGEEFGPGKLSPFTFTADEDFNVYFNPYITGATNIQLEIGLTATPYEAYNGESITRTYGATIYGGTDDVTGDGATSEWVLKTFTGASSENWQWTTSANYVQPYIEVVDALNMLGILSDIFETISVNDRGTKNGVCEYGDKLLRVGLLNDFGVSSLSDWKTWLGNHPLTLAYKLATPTSIPLTAQNITLLHGDNVLTTDADSIEASYSADIALYIAKKIVEGVNSTRSLSKGGSSETTEDVTEEGDER